METDSYLLEVLAAGTRSFRFRSGARRLLGQPDDGVGPGFEHSASRGLSFPYRRHQYASRRDSANAVLPEYVQASSPRAGGQWSETGPGVQWDTDEARLGSGLSIREVVAGPTQVNADGRAWDSGRPVPVSTHQQEICETRIGDTVPEEEIQLPRHQASQMSTPSTLTPDQGPASRATRSAHILPPDSGGDSDCTAETRPGTSGVPILNIMDHNIERSVCGGTPLTMAPDSLINIGQSPPLFHTTSQSSSPCADRVVSRSEVTSPTPPVATSESDYRLDDSVPTFGAAIADPKCPVQPGRAEPEYSETADPYTDSEDALWLEENVETPIAAIEDRSYPAFWERRHLHGLHTELLR